MTLAEYAQRSLRLRADFRASNRVLAFLMGTAVIMALVELVRVRAIGPQPTR